MWADTLGVEYMACVTFHFIPILADIFEFLGNDITKLATASQA